jgi:hypothetical protein
MKLTRFAHAPYSESQPTNGWMVVGMGDMLQIGDVAEAYFTGQNIKRICMLSRGGSSYAAQRTLLCISV